MTEEQIEIWESKLRYEIEETIRETRQKLLDEPVARCGYFHVAWTPKAFEA